MRYDSRLLLGQALALLLLGATGSGCPGAGGKISVSTPDADGGGPDGSMPDVAEEIAEALDRGSDHADEPAVPDAQRERVCFPACAGKECGDDGCGGSCGNCGFATHCDDGVCMPDCGDGACGPDEGCQTCPYDCGDCLYVCGDGICDYGGEDCMTCPKDCGYCPPVCGDGACDPDEDCSSCLEDCGECVAVCGNGVCEVWGEDCSICPKDCGCGPGAVCYAGGCCKPKCLGKECGSDSCGGSCGDCGGNPCIDFKCQSNDPVVDTCDGPGQPASKDCQGISYEGCCGKQGRLFYCDQDNLFCIDCGTQNTECGWSPENNFYDCGTDGGEDPSGTHPKSCKAGPCTPDCQWKECGSDGCGGSCGTCDDGNPCTKDSCAGGDCSYKPIPDCCKNLPDGTQCGPVADPWDYEYEKCVLGTCCHPHMEICWSGTCSCEGWPVYGTCASDCDALLGGTNWEAMCVKECGGDCCSKFDADCPADKPLCQAFPFLLSEGPSGRCVPAVLYPECWTQDDCKDGDVCTGAPGEEDCPFCNSDCPSLKPGTCVPPAGCGNSIVEPALGEQCDDGNLADGDGCDHSCHFECVPACAGKSCGPDGCGGKCGPDCAAGKVCLAGSCAAAGGPCTGLPPANCCDGQKLAWCKNGTLAVTDCTGYPLCGWHAAGWYDCSTAGLPDPSGQHSKDCTAIAPLP